MELLDKVKKLLEDRNILLTGGGGVGKSYLTTQLISALRGDGKQVVVLGSTGVSAVNVHGHTIHSFFCFGISNNLQEMKKNDKYTKQRVKELNKILYAADLLIIDEISMVSSDLLDMIRYRLDSGNFDGRLLFVGDFFQLPPVKSRVQNNSLFDGNEFAFESSSWDYFDPYIVELTRTKRTEDEEFFGILNRIRRGELDNEVGAYLSGLRNNLHVRDENPTILFGTNAKADVMNMQRLNLLEADPVVLKAKEKIHLPSLHVKRIESWKKNLPVPADLTLKVGANILFCTNKWGSYYNGERGIIKNLDEEEVIVEKNNGKVVKVKRAEYTLSESITLNNKIEEKPLVTLEQFPLKLAYAITIHKSQGMSIDSLVCNIDNIFEKSQFYVAISRAKNPKQLLIDYSYNSFENHLKNCVQVSPKVTDFYAKSELIKIEEDTLF
ncbi:ATP-dependent DNA helicase [Sulfurospirillum arcachonense]|uniref:ATP-dependent DNA helicase n=1 Tax=Sulfurospirillum arcachonense TaxID=57666 RepID=UPI00046834CF|nr:DEAD/DEAH box helicase [Sulfurospirillum arcachonense]